MNKKSTTSFRFSRRAGLTLIEVIAAIVILGTILVGIVLSKSRHTRQIALTQRKMEAVRAADRLLTRWWTGPDGIPVDKSGQVPQNPSLRWRTRVVPNPEVALLGARVVRLEILETRKGPGIEADATLADVEVVLALPPEEEDVDEQEDPPRKGGQP
jgi:prepilin-type N-terminal cleavage/methylation domain-containing protein